MNVIDKTVSNDIDLGVLLAALDAQPHRPLVFKYDGRDVKPGYHVTEVKSGRFDALDCGANPESWTEIFVQLWDVHEDGRTHMPAAKFSAIVRKVSEHVGLPKTAPDLRGQRRHRAHGGLLRVDAWGARRSCPDRAVAATC